MIQISTNLAEINRILNKYLNFINYFLEQLSGHVVYIESITDGFLVIWQDFDTFIRGFQPFPEWIHIEALQLNPQQNPLVKIAPSKQEYPPDGFQINFKCIYPMKYDQIIDILSEFFRFIDFGLVICQNYPNCTVIFPKYEHTVKYFNSLFLYFEATYGLFGSDPKIVQKSSP
jgi:hypothetical protein